MSLVANKPKLAWFTPSDLSKEGGRSLSFYVSKVILPLLKKDYDIQVFSDSFQEFFNEDTDLPSKHFLTATQLHADSPFDIVFYQLENSSASNFIRIHLALLPGICWFHDYVFSSFGPEPILNSAWQEFVLDFKNSYKQNLQEFVWPDRGNKHEPMGPIAYRESAFAVCSLFSNPNNVSDFKVNTKINLLGIEEVSKYFLPVPVAQNLFGKNRRAVNSSGIKKLALCCSPKVEFRIHSILSALKLCEKNIHATWLLYEEDLLRAKDLIKDFDLNNIDIQINKCPKAWKELLENSDFAIHLLFSFFVNDSPYREISFASGCTVIISDFGKSDYYSNNSLIKIAAGSNEAAELSACFELLCSNSFVNNAYDFALDENSEQKIVSELRYIFEKEKETLKNFYKAWANYNAAARKSLLDEFRGNYLKKDALLKGFDSVANIKDLQLSVFKDMKIYE